MTYNKKKEVYLYTYFLPFIMHEEKRCQEIKSTNSCDYVIVQCVVEQCIHQELTEETVSKTIRKLQENKENKEIEFRVEHKIDEKIGDYCEVINKNDT